MASDTSISTAFSLSIMISSLLSVIYLLFSPSLKTKTLNKIDDPNKNHEKNKTLFVAALAIVLFSLPFYLYVQIVEWKLSISGTYVSLYSSIRGFLRIFSGLFCPGALMLLVSMLYSKHTKLWYCLFFAFLFLLAFNSLKGTRFVFVVYGIVLAFVLFLKPKPKKLQKVLIFIFLLGVSLLPPLLAYISANRSSGSISIHGFFNYLFSYGLIDALSKNLIEFGGTISSTYLSVEYIPSYSPYLCGLTYLVSLLSIYPNVFNVYGGLTKYYTFVYFFPSVTQNSLGGSVIGEAYANFGFWGTIIFLGIVFFLLIQIDKTFWTTLISRNLCKMFFCLFVFLFYIEWVRGYFVTEIFNSFILFIAYIFVSFVKQKVAVAWSKTKSKSTK